MTDLDPRRPRRGADGSGYDDNGNWIPPLPTVGFCVSSYKTWPHKRTRYTAWVNTVNIWGMQDQPHFRGWTEKEALDKAIEDAKKRYPEEMANTTLPPRISYLP